MPPRHRRGLAGHADIGTPDIAVADDFRQHELRGVAGDRKADALRAAMMAVLIPITSAALDTSAPPELPGLSAASVWITSSMVRPLTERIERPSAETTPAVTVDSKPSGLPIATTSWPRRRLLELPSDA